MKAKGTTAAERLSPQLRELLLHGPWHIGLTLRTMPPHDALRALWARHGAALAASLPRGQKPWFVERDWVVRMVRGEA